MNLLSVAIVLLGTTLVVASVRANFSAYLDEETQIKFVAAVIIHEAGGEGEEGMQLVANCIQNRMYKHKTRWGFTPYEVVCKKGQFSCLRGVSDLHAFIDYAERGWPNQWNLAVGMSKHLHEVLGGKAAYCTKLSGYPTHFYTAKTTIHVPNPQKFHHLGQVGHHNFFEEN